MAGTEFTSRENTHIPEDEQGEFSEDDSNLGNTSMNPIAKAAKVNTSRLGSTSISIDGSGSRNSTKIGTKISGGKSRGHGQTQGYSSSKNKRLRDTSDDMIIESDEEEEAYMIQQGIVPNKNNKAKKYRQGSSSSSHKQKTKKQSNNNDNDYDDQGVIDY